MVETTMQSKLPGFRFHPTEEELLDFYLKNTIFGNKIHCNVIGFLNIYRHDPRELPGLAKIGEREWYFFVPRDRRHGNTGRPNRTTSHGFWKATGNERKIFSLSDPKRILGFRKTLVFYNGRAPNGSKTDWVMNEYRLLDSVPSSKDIVLCKIYRKATSLKVLEERAAMEDKMKTIDHHGSPSATSPLDTTNSQDMTNNSSFYYQQREDQMTPLTSINELVPKTEVEEVVLAKDENSEKEELKRTCLQLPLGNQELELQVPMCNMDWSQDSLWLNSPWLQNFISFVSPTF